MKISSIELKHTNPSLGPYEQITTISLYVNETHQTRVDEFLSTAMVNQTVSLADYIKAYQENNQELLDKVHKNAPKGRLNEGENISYLTLYFSGDIPSLEFYDVYRRWSLTNFYPNFTSYMVEHGSKTTHSADDPPFAKIPILEDKDEDRNTSQEPPIEF